MKGGRVYANPTNTSVIVEASESDPRVETLVRRGHEVRRLDALGRLNVVYCSSGLPVDSLRNARCSPESDTRGDGLGATVVDARWELADGKLTLTAWELSPTPDIGWFAKALLGTKPLERVDE